MSDRPHTWVYIWGKYLILKAMGLVNLNYRLKVLLQLLPVNTKVILYDGVNKWRGLSLEFVNTIQLV